jgi:dTDP-4-dehydrorhamnose 3,5-epimerase
MLITPLKIPEIFIIKPHTFEDLRGEISEVFRLDLFKERIGLKENFVQDNQVRSSCGVLRGLHYQLPPYAQGKFVIVVQGKIFDVAVDLRKSSPTFGKYISQILSAENKKKIWIPEGFAHGFITLSKTSNVIYKLTNYHNIRYERCILWNDEDLKIKWPKCEKIILSNKDLLGLSMNNAEKFP